MSRYYRVEIGPEVATPIGGAQASNNAGAVFTNRVNGKCDTGAQTLEMDVQVTQFATPAGQAWVRIWGPSLQQISQASDFNGAPIRVYAGMQDGLPLATSEVPQAGLIVSGMVYQAFGNWQGINQTLDFVISVDGGATQDSPAPLSFLWNKGEPLAPVLQQTLSSAYPKYQIKVNISPDLKLPQDESGVYQTLEQFARYIQKVTQPIIGGSYTGVNITLRDNVIIADDGTQNVADTVELLAQDLVGQPTWLGAFTVQFSTVMRADLDVGRKVKFPAVAGLQAITSANSQSNARSKSAFQGTWTIVYIRHVGNSRAPEAQNWISVFQAFSNDAPPEAGGSSA